MNKAPDLTVFYEIIKKERGQKLTAGILVTAAGMFLMTDPFRNFALAGDFFFLFGCIVFVAGIYLVYNGIKMFDHNNTVLFQIINEQPQDVVWVYHYFVESMPFGVKTRTMCNIYINLIDGRREVVKVRKSRVKYTLQQMRRIFPSATYGHNVEKEQLFRANPALLKQF